MVANVPSPIKLVLLGETHGPGITMVPAGSRRVDGAGFAIPAHGLGLVVVQVMFVLFELSPRASITVPEGGKELLLRILFNTAQIFGFWALTNMLASMKPGEPTQQVPDAG